MAIQPLFDELDALLQPGVTLTIENTGDELALRINDREILRLYDRPETPFIAAQWRHTLRDANVTEAYDGKRPNPGGGCHRGGGVRNMQQFFERIDGVERIERGIEAAHPPPGTTNRHRFHRFVRFPRLSHTQPP